MSYFQSSGRGGLFVKILHKRSNVCMVRALVTNNSYSFF